MFCPGLNPKNLIELDEFNQEFFDEIDKIENRISQGDDFETILKNINTEITEVKEFIPTSVKKENEDEIVLKYDKDYPHYFNKIRFNEESLIEEDPREIKIKRDGFNNKKELILTKIIIARKSGTTLFESDLFSKMAEERTKQIKVSDVDTESTFKVSLFDK